MFSHAEVGAYLLGLWGLPLVIVDAVCRHHRPTADRPGEGLDVRAITHIANALALEVANTMPADTPACFSVLDQEYLTAIAVAEQLPEWRSMAQGIVAGQARA